MGNILRDRPAKESRRADSNRCPNLITSELFLLDEQPLYTTLVIGPPILDCHQGRHYLCGHSI